MRPRRQIGAAEEAFLLENICFARIPCVKVTVRQSNGSTIFIAACLHLGNHLFAADQQGGGGAGGIIYDGEIMYLVAARGEAALKVTVL